MFVFAGAELPGLLHDVDGDTFTFSTPVEVSGHSVTQPDPTASRTLPPAGSPLPLWPTKAIHAFSTA